MHENREISCTSWSKDQDRSAKAINRTADVNVQEKSDCAVVPVNQPNNEGQPSTEAGEGRAQTKENIVQTHIAPDPERETHVPGIVRCAVHGISILMSASPPLILSKSRMRRRARTDLCGGRSVMVVPTATVIQKRASRNSRLGLHSTTLRFPTGLMDSALGLRPGPNFKVARDSLTKRDAQLRNNIRKHCTTR